MKKVVAIFVVLVLVMSCTVAFAAKETTTTTTGEKKGFWREFADLFQKKIPDTFNQKSDTHRMWEQTPGRGKTDK
jgi:hypothetical protein